MGGLIGGAIGAVAANQAAKQQIQQGILNDRAYQLSAADATERGNQEAGKASLKSGQLMGDARTALASSGVDSQSGSGLQALADTRAYSKLDQLTIQNNAAREAWGYKLKGYQALEQGKADATNTLVGGLAGFEKSSGGGFLG
jgi:hypothetical protein